MIGEVQIDRPAAVELPAHRLPPSPASPAPQPPAYYDVPMLQAPVWESPIAVYFFLGGVSAGSYLLARMAAWFGGDTYRPVTRAGTTVAVLAVLPCAPLLIEDLGAPRRFHHMLRVFKPGSPMNLGAWVLTGFSGVAGLALLREWRRSAAPRPSLASKLGKAAMFVVLDGAGIPLALLLGTYTGVLLSCTATPIWCKNPWLAPLFSAGALGNGASATRLALEFLPESERAQAATAVEDVRTTAHLAEAAALAGYVQAAGPLADPLLHGEAAPYLWGAALGLLGSELLAHAPRRTRWGRWARVAGAALGLASGLALRLGILQAGKPSAKDPDAARRASTAVGQTF